MDNKNLEMLLKDLKANMAKTTWSIFLGAGASVSANLPTMVDLTRKVLNNLKSETKHHEIVSEIVSVLNNFKKCEHLKETKKEVLEDYFRVNIEDILSVLYQILYLKMDSNSIVINYGKVKNISHNDIADCIKILKELCTKECKVEYDLITHKQFIKKWIEGTSKVDIFTTNWDLVVEHTSDSLLIEDDIELRCIDGFKGTYIKIYDQTTYDDVIKTKMKAMKIINLYKLHGSIDWRKQGEEIIKSESSDNEEVLIYPTPLKFKEVLGAPYMELLRRFSNTIEDETCNYLLIIGYSFADSHINNIVKNATKRSDFNVFVVNPFLDETDLRSILGTKANIRSSINLCFGCFVRYVKGGEDYESFMGRECNICNRR